MNAETKMPVDAIEFLNKEHGLMDDCVNLEKPLQELFDECLKFISVGDFYQ